MKTNSSAKKRFKITASGKVSYPKAYKQHINRKKNRKSLRNLKGTGILSKSDTPNLIKFFLPNGK